MWMGDENLSACKGKVKSALVYNTGFKRRVSSEVMVFFFSYFKVKVDKLLGYLRKINAPIQS